MGFCIPVISWMAKNHVIIITWMTGLGRIHGVTDTTQIILGCIISTILVWIIGKVLGKVGGIILIILGFVGIPAGGIGIALIVIGIIFLVIGASAEVAALLNASTFLLYLLCYGFRF